ncbi:MAG: hypothetical protein K1Y36_08395 [Blastocatellia bacterium]|nr:hypothetical protein [Blastocatellia bacterium]
MVLRYVCGVLALVGMLGCSSETTLAQKARSSKKPKTTKSAPAPAAPVKTANTAAAEKRAGAQQIAVQLKGMTQFLYVFGGITKGFEAVEEASDANNVPSSVTRKTERTRYALADTIRTIQGNLERLENDFSSSSNLRPYFHFIVGAADTAALSQRQVKDGQLKEAGQSLIKIANQLTEALAGMQD